MHDYLHIIINRLGNGFKIDYIHNIIDDEKVVWHGILGLQKNGIYYAFFLLNLSKSYINGEWQNIYDVDDLEKLINEAIG